MFYVFKSDPGFGFIEVGCEYLYPQGVPADAIQITDEEHADFLQKQAEGTHEGFNIIDGKWVYTAPPAPTIEEQQAMLQRQLTAAVQSFMDQKAHEKGYDNLLTAVTYAEEPSNPKFQKEGMAFRTWRSEVWAYCYDQVAAVKAGKRTAPTGDQLISELPELKMPTE